MTTMPITTRLPFIQAILELLGHERGHAAFVVGEDGELLHIETVTTVKMEAGESLERFHARLRALAQPGDRIEILNNGGRCDTARISHKSAA